MTARAPGDPRRLNPDEAVEVLTSVAVPVLVLDGEGALRWANEAALRLIPRQARAVDDLATGEEAAILRRALHGSHTDLLPLQFDGPAGRQICSAAVRPLSAGGAVVTLTAVDTEGTVSGLPGRTVFMRRLSRSLRRARSEARYGFAVMVVDLDGFKLVNDSLGRACGDALLRAVAGRLLDCLRPGDEVAQLTGDEFAILVDRIATVDSALPVVQRLQEAMRPAFAVCGQELFARAGIGVALSSSGYAEPEDMLRDSVTAMNRAKAQGQGRFEIYDGDMRDRARERLRLESDLRRGIERGEFVLHYQPIVSLRDGFPHGFEALLRWQHPERGLLPPAEFIRVAEETGLIVPMVDAVFAAACTQVRKWRERFAPVALSMNFTPVQFQHDAVVAPVHLALETSGLQPGALVVEITETALVSEFAPVAAVLQELRELGIHVHLDDFGTGYSSLSYLHHLPIDALKIDRSFVSRLGQAPSAEVLVKAILDLAVSLEKEAIGEGIETENQAGRLRALGCPFGQGYLFSKAMAPAAAEAWLAQAVS